MAASLFSRKTQYFFYSSDPVYSEVREGTSITMGKPLRGFMRLYGGYTWETVDSASSEEFEQSQEASSVAGAADTLIAGDDYDRERHDHLHAHHRDNADARTIPSSKDATSRAASSHRWCTTRSTTRSFRVTGCA